MIEMAQGIWTQDTDRCEPQKVKNTVVPSYLETQYLGIVSPLS